MTAPRRICFPFRGNTYGGSHVSSLTLIKNLDPARYESVIVLHAEDGPLAAQVRKTGLSYHLMPVSHFPIEKKDFLPRHWKDYHASLRAIRAFLKAQDIALVQSNDKPMRVLWGVPTKLSSRRFIHFQRSPLLAHDLEQAVSFRLCDYALGISRYVTATLPPYLKRRRFIDAPYDTDADPPDRAACRGRLLRRLGAGEDCAIVGYAANLQPRKRPLFFADVAAEVLRRHDGTVVFPMIGRAYGDFERQLKDRIAALDLEGKVVYLGFSEQPEDFLAACDVFVAPAVEEASGRTIIESMLAGTPVVASGSGGHPEYIESEINGFLIDPQRPDLFAGKIADLLQDPAQARALAQRARSGAVARFSARKHACDVMEVYDELLDKN